MRLHLRLGCRRRCDLVDLAVLEGRHFGGFRHRFLVQGAAALLVVLGQVVSLLRRFFALEGGQGNFHGPADFFGLGKGETDAEDQHQVQQRRQEQGKAQAIHRAYAGWREVGGDVSRQRHQVSSNCKNREKPAEQVPRS
ncbi:hypothetical protein D9M71_629410 [compost metagenome]